MRYTQKLIRSPVRGSNVCSNITGARRRTVGQNPKFWTEIEKQVFLSHILHIGVFGVLNYENDLKTAKFKMAGSIWRSG